MVGNLERMLSPLLSSGGQESSSIPPASHGSQSTRVEGDSTQGSSAAEDLTPLQQHGQGTETWNRHFHGIVNSQPSSTNVRKQTFSKGNGSLKSVRNESPCRDPSKQASTVTVSWEQSFILTWKHLNLLPCLPLCSHCDLKMNLLKRTQNRTKAQISYNYYFHNDWSK